MIGSGRSFRDQEVTARVETEADGADEEIQIAATQRELLERRRAKDSALSHEWKLPARGRETTDVTQRASEHVRPERQPLVQSGIEADKVQESSGTFGVTASGSLLPPWLNV